MNLKEIEDNRIISTKICLRFTKENSLPITQYELDTILQSLSDLKHLTDLVNYLGEKALVEIDKERLNSN